MESVAVLKQVKMNVAIISEEQKWQRNKEFKNWGQYRPFLFKKGVPRVLLPNTIMCVYYIIFQFFFLIISSLDAYHQRSSLFVLILSGLACFVNCVFFYLLITKDLGISSIGDPLINKNELSVYQKFCLECKCIQNQTIKHCPECKVCIENSFVHLKISKMCITKKNYVYFCGICCLSIMQALILL